MKKTLIAMAVLGAASGFAMAASNVTLYGKIETGVVLSNASGTLVKDGKKVDTPSRVEMKSGFDSGSRWGIKGTEDLGNGYSVGFILEQGFNSDNGGAAEPKNQFNRESILSVKGDFGSVAVGRTGALSYAQSRAILTGWVFGTGYGASSWNAIDSIAGRMNNVVSYASPKVGGLTLHAMYSNSGKGDTQDDARWSENGHYYGIGALYQEGGIKSSLIYEVLQNKNLTENARNPKYGINYGLEWDLGGVTPMFGYQYTWQDKGMEVHQFGLSAKTDVAGGTAKIGARYTIGKNDAKNAKATYGEDEGTVWFVGGAYEYPLSKRTMIKTYAGYAQGDKLFDTDCKYYQNQKWDDAVKFNGYQAFVGLMHNF